MDVENSSTCSSSEDSASNFVSVKSFFFMRTLFKITSMRSDSNVLSFCFKIPDVFKSAKLEATKYLKFIEKFDLSLLKELVLAKRLNEMLHEIHHISSDEAVTDRQTLTSSSPTASLSTYLRSLIVRDQASLQHGKRDQSNGLHSQVQGILLFILDQLQGSRK